MFIHKPHSKTKHTLYELQQISLQYLEFTDKAIYEKFRLLVNHYAIIIANNLNFLPPLIVYHHEIDLIKLFDFSSALYEKCIYFPAYCQYIFQEAIDSEIKRHSCLIPCKFYLQSSIFSFIADGNCSAAKNGALCQFRHYVLTAMTVPAMRNHVALYRCVNNTCAGYNGQYISAGNGFNDRYKTCLVCGNAMIEDLKGRRQIQVITAIFISSELKSKNEALCESLKCTVHGLLEKELELGATYHIWGYYTFNSFELWGLKKEKSFALQPPNSRLSSNNGIILSSLKQIDPDNPWLLPLYFASQIDQSEQSSTPLKMALILSLVSMAHNTPVSVLCLGSDFANVDRLMNLAAMIVGKTVEVTSPLNGGVMKNEADDQIWLHGGVSAFGNHGVCITGDWMTLTAAQRKEILSIIEAGQTIISTKNIKLMELTPTPLSLPLKTVFWSFIHYDNYHGQNTSLYNLIDIFGIPVINTSTNELMTADNLLNSLPVCDLPELIRITTGINVELTEEAVQLIKDYFSAARKLRGDKFPLRSITLLTIFAKAHAQLALRNAVLYDDVVAIIYIYENSLCRLYGDSISSQPPFRPLSLNNVHETMAIFKQWLKCYLMSIVQ